MEIILISFILGLFSAVIGSLVGLGGGVFIVPGLLYLSDQFTSLTGITPQIAVGTSLMVIIFSSASSTFSYARMGRVDFKSGLFFFGASAPGTLVGSFFTIGLAEHVFQLIFGSILLLIFYLLVKNKKMSSRNIKWHVTKEYRDEQGNHYQYGYHRYVAILICFAVGFLQGLLGIGGGTLLVPALLLLFWYPTVIAIPTSMFVIFLSSVVGSFSHFMMGNIEWNVLPWLVLGGLLGGQVGALISKKIKVSRLNLLLRGLIFLLGLSSIWQGISHYVMKGM